MKIDVKLSLTDINQVLKDFNVKYEILTKNYYSFQDSIKNFKKMSKFHINLSKSIILLSIFIY
jgi:hypothetical protein